LGADSRYFYTPNFLVVLAVVIALIHGNGIPRPTRLAAVTLLTWVLGVGCFEFFNYPAYFYSGPPWREEVATWRRSPDRRLRISPWVGWNNQGSWSIALSDVVSAGETPMRDTKKPMLSTVSLSGGRRLAQRFRAGTDVISSISVQTITWARPAAVHDYPIEWDLYELGTGGKTLVTKGVLRARDIGDWTAVDINLETPIRTDGGWYELGFRSPADVPSERSVGMPLYAVGSEDRLQLATVDDAPASGQGAIKLGVCCTTGPAPPISQGK